MLSKRPVGIWAAKAWWQHFCGRKNIKMYLNVLMNDIEITKIPKFCISKVLMPICSPRKLSGFKWIVQVRSA